jgi:hypothetical protein
MTIDEIKADLQCHTLETRLFLLEYIKKEIVDMIYEENRADVNKFHEERYI